MKVAVAIPAFNCEFQIGRVLSELDPILSAYPQICSVFVIENRSADNTLSAAITSAESLENRQMIEIYQNPKNYGLGGTHKVALSLCKSMKISHLILLHGDHQASPGDISPLLERLARHPESHILGSRFMDLNRLSGYSRTRTLGNLALNFLYSLATGRKISDLGSGLNIFNVQTLDEKAYQQFDNSFTFNMDLLLHLVRAKLPFCYVPISWTTKDQISNAKTFQVGKKTLKKLVPWLLRIELRNENHFDSVKIR